MHQSQATIESTIQATCQYFQSQPLFYGHGSDSPWDEAVFLVLAACDYPLDSRDDILPEKLTQSQQDKISLWRAMRVEQRLPLPYITGFSYFCGLRFEVDSRVLIPRSPIGEMILNEFKPWLINEPRRILDLCTGSGCIAIALAKAFPNALVDATDLSLDALSLAKINRHNHQLEDRVSFFEGDLFQPVPKTNYQLIVSNPPYVDKKDMDELPQEYLNEPKLALAAGLDGLDLVHIMLKDAVKYLAKDGILVIEVGNSAEALENAYPTVPFTWVEFENGGDGVFVLTYQELKNYLL
ncbi:MAG: 50S ribosomal protein L3 N(5)-glutamine methyltransferase [Gammaproteobacteria bacterium CG22_combo_CG10-13_8_21_14_all_40_8]|nr:MAG: 50S ribosomal protein L3 N(5)-glutamine methyltransferase [Gammaproteobacteria bacterium CG22_combo_CG10-13_8_21_14_all_40_8]